MRKKRLYWTLQYLGWGVYAVLNGVIIYLNPEDYSTAQQIDEIINLVAHVTLLFLISHFFLRTIIIKRDWLKINIGKVIPRLFLAIFIGMLFAVILMIPINRALQPLDFTSANDLSNFILLPSLSYTVLFVIWCSIYILYHYLESNNRSLKYEAAMNEMHLNQLKSQLNPHFIFNALNSMRALVDEEPKKAKVAITQLSNILRNSLITDMKRVVNFKDELNTIKDYLALESIRFEERLQVEYNIAPGSEYFEVPPMMLQTITENAIKHGVSNLVQGGLISISTNIDNSVMTIKIRNSGQLHNSIKSGRKGTKVGLVNTQERLKLIYGEGATFRMYNESDKFVVVEVNIPQRI